MKNKLLHFVAKVVLRLHRYYQDTYPASIIIPIIGGFIAFYATGLDEDFQNHMSFGKFFEKFSVLSAKIIFTFKLTVYLIWESVQGWKALKHWATNYIHAKQNKKN
jgi:hypothetical protein